MGNNEEVIRENKITRKCLERYLCNFKVCEELCHQFKIIIGVMQGCVLSPLNYNVFLELIIATALEDEEIGMQIGGVRINNLCFADDTHCLLKVHMSCRP